MGRVASVHSCPFGTKFASLHFHPLPSSSLLLLCRCDHCSCSPSFSLCSLLFQTSFMPLAYSSFEMPACSSLPACICVRVCMNICVLVLCTSRLLHPHPLPIRSTPVLFLFSSFFCFQCCLFFTTPLSRCCCFLSRRRPLCPCPSPSPFLCVATFFFL